MKKLGLQEAQRPVEGRLRMVGSAFAGSWPVGILLPANRREEFGSCGSQRFQYPLIKEYSLNQIGDPTTI